MVMSFQLHPKLGAKNIERESTRKGFGRGLVAAAENDSNIVGLTADLMESVGMQPFAEAYPERFVDVGVAEQNLVTVASGMAAVGKRPFAASYAAFSPGRNWEQIRTTICLNNQPVVIVGSHAGISVGPDGATHQMLEDIALMRSLPNMTVVAPGDSVEAEKATLALAKHATPSYLRLSRDSTPVFTTPLSPFEIGRAYVMREGSDVTILATGTLTYHALLAAVQLEKEDISVEVVHVPTIKPLDSTTILASVRKTKRVVTVEEAQVAAGFGSAVCELVSEYEPLPVLRVGVQDTFGGSGEAAELLQKHGLNAEGIALRVYDFLQPLATQRPKIKERKKKHVFRHKRNS